MSNQDPARVERACELMHQAYEEAAVIAGWATNPRSAVPWSEVPEANRVTMRAAVEALLDWADPTDPPALRLVVVDEGDRWDVSAELDDEGLDEGQQCGVLLCAMEVLERLHRTTHVLAQHRN